MQLSSAVKEEIWGVSLTVFGSGFSHFRANRAPFFRSLRLLQNACGGATIPHAGFPRRGAGMTVRFARNDCVPCGGMALFKRGGDTAYWGMAMLYSNASGATHKAGTTPVYLL